ncbi:class I SAM-dependent methyltransferase [Evansella halocellulosilytica]|uniref:class I SAM-dependent methyltransferase n=1 Tax=Evansella halocellulosilytica TaxID=2011013 RepID=UPI000BB793A1|nr:class I SAM-dependent methyltransferase [Evansella halocellulosilytica]
MLRNDNDTTKLFDEWAKSYDDDLLQASGPLYGYNESLHAVQNILSVTANDTLLDIGIGTGTFASLISDKNSTVHGVDISNKMLEECKHKHPTYELKQGTFLNTRQHNSFFNYVITSFAFHEVYPQKRLTALQEIHRVLKSGGKLLLLDIMFPSSAAREDGKKQIGHYWDDSEDYPIGSELDTQLRKAGFHNIVWKHTAPFHWAVKAEK